MSKTMLGNLVPLLEAKLGLKTGFFEALDADDESDWSFIIKLHALIEAAISYLLSADLQRPELTELFSRLEMSNKSTGKAAFVKALDLLGEPERRFISSLSELRNDLVHEIKNVTFNLDEYVEGMDQKRQEIFLKNFNLISTEVTNDVKNIFRFDPRSGIWYSSMALLGIVYLKLHPHSSD